MTKNIANATGHDSATGCTVATKDEFYVLIDSNVAPGTAEAVYRWVPESGGNPDRPLTVRVGHYVKGSNGNERTNISIKLSTVMIDSELENPVVGPVDLTLAWSTPGRTGVPNMDDLSGLIDLAHSWAVPRETGVGTVYDNLAKLAYGIPQLG